MAGPVNGIVGGTTSPLGDIPESTAQLSDESLTSARRLAAFTRTQEFKDLKEVLEAKIDRWKDYIPGASTEILAGDAVPMSQLGNAERGSRWLAADAVINELRGIINIYEQAAGLVEDENAK